MSAGSRLFAAGAVAFALTAEAAAGLPAFNVEAYCADVAATVGGSYVIEEGCRTQEAQAIAALRTMEIEPRILRHCTDVAQTIGGSYMILHGCVQQELRAKQRLSQ